MAFFDTVSRVIANQATSTLKTEHLALLVVQARQIGDAPLFQHDRWTTHKIVCVTGCWVKVVLKQISAHETS